MMKHVKKLFLIPMVALSISFIPSTVYADEIFYTADRVNLRSSLGTDAPILKTVSRGEAIIMEDYDPSGWSKVTYKGLSGYMKSEFLAVNYVVDSSDEPLMPGEQEVSTAGSGVELLPWSEVKQIFTIGKDTQVTDCYTGITYYVRTFSNGLHADVEPVTKEDTALLKQTYGGTWDWDPRPVLVNINGRLIAGSINGMPHGGGVNPNNGMDGQVCIHFKGSTTHNGNKSFTNLHQEKAIEAYNLNK